MTDVSKQIGVGRVSFLTEEQMSEVTAPTKETNGPAGDDRSAARMRQRATTCGPWSAPKPATLSSKWHAPGSAAARLGRVEAVLSAAV